MRPIVHEIRGSLTVRHSKRFIEKRDEFHKNYVFAYAGDFDYYQAPLRSTRKENQALGNL